MSRIRQLSELVAISTESIDTKWMTMVYYVGLVRKLPIDGVTVNRKISQIVELEKHYMIYITNDNTTQEWKKIPKSDRVTEEYFID